MDEIVEEMVERVYGSIIGMLIKELRLPWVENEFLPGKPYHQNYGDALDAYRRLCDRLGTGEDDDDVEIIFSAFLDNEKLLCLKMFRYGMEYQKQIQGI